MQFEGSLRDSHKQSDELLEEQPLTHWRETNECATIQSSSSASASSPSSSSPIGATFIEHRVSKMDTLAGVAIKYGVEVADIRRMNGLVTDLQMFALKSLQIPLPGRHPPSPIMSNGSSQNRIKTHRRQSCDNADSLRPLELNPSPHRVSPAMSSLQGYYGLTKSSKSRLPEGTEMTVYKSGKTLLFDDQKSQILANGYSLQNGNQSENIDELDLSTRRRPKPDEDPLLDTPEILLKEEGASGVFTGRAGKGLALRSKLGDASPSVRKSSSSTNLNEPENIPNIWPTSKWSLKPDVIARPIFDGFQKPLTAWRSKTALD